MGISWMKVAAAAGETQLLEGVSPESIFGGLILLTVLSLLVSGKLRLEREVNAKNEVIEIKNETIEEQRKTIAILVQRDEVTHHLLREIRNVAYGHGADEDDTP